MSHSDDPDRRRRTLHGVRALGRQARLRRCRAAMAPDRPRLRLVYGRRAPSLPFGIHPGLPSALAFAAVSMTALAYAALVDAANGAGAIAANVAARLRAALG
ncbi:MAG: hypothetical protein B6D46_12850 [Polyangiaceae bacterium UTPRO1]|jgi:hypothetical protein|nr:hypothetical protein [Myxococcales bacterium]OQY65584.1 MAG: hypothetical protein B6D46_12850 [Polyangiaceae bacterium UTPRO1]